MSIIICISVTSSILFLCGFRKGDIMATKSICKNITIKDKNLGRSLVNALENAQNKTSKNVIYSKMVKEIKGEKIKDLFGAGS